MFFCVFLLSFQVGSNVHRVLRHRGLQRYFAQVGRGHVGVDEQRTNEYYSHHSSSRLRAYLHQSLHREVHTAPLNLKFCFAFLGVWCGPLPPSTHFALFFYLASQEAFGLGLGMDVEAHSFLQQDPRTPKYIPPNERGDELNYTKRNENPAAKVAPASERSVGGRRLSNRERKYERLTHRTIPWRTANFE